MADEFQPTTDNSYVSRQGDRSEVPVVSDQERIEDPIDENIADPDAQLDHDDANAIDESNIIDERTRHAKPEGSYREPGDDEGIPDDSGTSSADAKEAE